MAGEMKPSKIIPRWIRLTDEGMEILEREFDKAGTKCSSNWEWFCDVLDYREMCRRHSVFRTFKDQLRAIALKVAEWLAK